MKLFPHQVAAVNHFATLPSGLLADEPGLGKTATLVNVALRRANGRPIMVVCPRNVIRHWKESFKTWAPQLVGLVTVTNYEQLKNVSEALNPSVLIIDESHKLKNETSGRFQSCYRLLAKWKTASVIYGYGLSTYLATGTPVYSYPIDLMTALLLMGSLDHDKIPYFKLRYCHPTRRRVSGGRKVLDLRGSSNLDELKRALSHCVIRRTFKDAGVKMPAITLTELFVRDRMTDPDYKAASADFSKWYKEHGGGDHAGLAKFSVLRKILAMAKAPFTVEQTCDDLKGGSKAVVFSEFRDSATLMASSLEAEGYRAFLIMGGQTEKARRDLIAEFIAHPDPCALVATTDSLGEGTDGLQGVCHIANFNDSDFEPTMFVQALRRLWRIGQSNPVVVRRCIVEEDPMEEFIRTNWLKKESIQRQLGFDDTTSLTNLSKG